MRRARPGKGGVRGCGKILRIPPRIAGIWYNIGVMKMMKSARFAIKSVYIAVAAFVAGGCGGEEPVAHIDEPEFIAFDAETFASAAACGAGSSMDYASLDGKGLWTSLGECAAPPGVAEANIEKSCVRCSAAFESMLAKLYLDAVRLPGYEPEGRFAAWKVTNEVFVVIEYEDAGRTKPALCDFVLFDGIEMRHLVPFAAAPPSGRIWDSLMNAKTDPAALNNIAAMALNGVALRSAFTPEHAKALMMIAAGAGDPVACRNMAKLCEMQKPGASDRGRRRDFWLRRAAVSLRQRLEGATPKIGLLKVADWPR